MYSAVATYVNELISTWAVLVSGQARAPSDTNYCKHVSIFFWNILTYSSVLLTLLILYKLSFYFTSYIKRFSVSFGVVSTKITFDRYLIFPVSFVINIAYTG